MFHFFIFFLLSFCSFKILCLGKIFLLISFSMVVKLFNGKLNNYAKKFRLGTFLRIFVRNSSSGNVSRCEEYSCVLDNVAISTGNHSHSELRKFSYKHVKKGKRKTFCLFSCFIEWRKNLSRLFLSSFLSMRAEINVSIKLFPRPSWRFPRVHLESPPPFLIAYSWKSFSRNFHQILFAAKVVVTRDRQRQLHGARLMNDCLMDVSEESEKEVFLIFLHPRRNFS